MNRTTFPASLRIFIRAAAMLCALGLCPRATWADSGRSTGEVRLDEDPDEDPEEATMVVKPSSALKKECASGWVLMVWDETGTVHKSAPGKALTVSVSSSWHGWAGVVAQCAGWVWKDWSSQLGKTAKQAGLVSITINGFELATAHSLVCHDPWGPGDKPMVPLDAPNFGKCP